MPQDTPSRKLDQYIVRFPQGMRDRLKTAAAANKRSMNAEIISRLEMSFDVDPEENPLQFRDRILAGGADDVGKDNAPADVLTAQLQKAVREAIRETIDYLSAAGIQVEMALTNEKDEVVASYKRPPKRHQRYLDEHSGEDEPST